MSRFFSVHKSASILAICLSLGLSACVSKKIEPAYIPKIATSQNYEGVITISWPSRKGYTYRLAVREEGTIIYDKNVYRGTGESIVVQFKRDPGKPLPNYVVIPEKIVED